MLMDGRQTILYCKLTDVVVTLSHVGDSKRVLTSNHLVLFVCVGVLRPSQQQGHVEPVN